MCTRMYPFLWLFTALVPLARAEAPNKTAAIYSEWTGKWAVSEPLNRALGFQPGQRDDAMFEHPLAFQLQLDANLGDSMDAQKLQVYQDHIRTRLNQKVVATGQWETKFESDSKLDTNCFVTVGEGGTYLWVEAPFIVLYGGKVSFLTGRDRDQDAFIIDFRPQEKHRSQDTVVFQRSR